MSINKFCNKTDYVSEYYYRVYINSHNHNCYFKAWGSDKEVLKLVRNLADSQNIEIDVLIQLDDEWRLIWEISPGKLRAV